MQKLHAIFAFVPNQDDPYYTEAITIGLVKDCDRGKLEKELIVINEQVKNYCLYDEDCFEDLPIMLKRFLNRFRIKSGFDEIYEFHISSEPLVIY